MIAISRLLVAAVMLSLGLVRARRAQADDAEPDAIRAVLDAQAAAWNRGDIDGFMAGYAPSPDDDVSSPATK